RVLRVEVAVRDRALPGLEGDAAGLGVGAQALAVDHLLGRLQLFGETLVTPHDAFHLGLLRGRCRLVRIDEQHVTHVKPPLVIVRAASGPQRRPGDPHSYDAGDLSKSTVTPWLSIG